MKHFVKIATVAGIVILGIVLLFFGYIKKTEREDKQIYAEKLKREAQHKQNFVNLVQKLEKENLIGNSEKFVTLHSEACCGLPLGLLPLTVSTFKKNPKAGLLIFAQLCSSFYSSAEGSEIIHEEVSLLFFQEREKFIEGLTAQFDNNNFDCLLNYIDFPTDISQQKNFNYELEDKKVVDSLKNSKFKDNVNVQRVIKKFGGNKE